MKYIRTKDGRIHEVIAEEDTRLCIGVTFEKNIYINKKDILKQADTIEELCDEFVVTNNKRYNHCFLMTNKLKRAKEEYDVYQPNDGNEVDLFGAIWNDKGLIYVAKMNEKGDLELL